MGWGRRWELGGRKEGRRGRAHVFFFFFFGRIAEREFRFFQSCSVARLEDCREHRHQISEAKTFRPLSLRIQRRVQTPTHPQLFRSRPNARERNTLLDPRDDDVRLDPFSKLIQQERFLFRRRSVLMFRPKPEPIRFRPSDGESELSFLSFNERDGPRPIQLNPSGFGPLFGEVEEGGGRDANDGRRETVIVVVRKEENEAIHGVEVTKER